MAYARPHFRFDAILAALAVQFVCTRGIPSVLAFFHLKGGPAIFVVAGLLGGVLAGVFFAAVAKEARRSDLLIATAYVALFDVLTGPLMLAHIGLSIAIRALIVALTMIPGGLAYIAVERRLYARAGQKTWHHRCADGTPIQVLSPPASRTLTAAWIVLGVALIGTFWIPPCQDPVDPVSIADAEAQNSANGRLGLAWLAVGVVCISVSRRHKAKSVDDVLAKDTRPPVVYLRSFQDDGRAMDEGFWAEARKVFFSPFRAVMALVNKTIEQRLAKHLNRIGPLVAIGRPGEELPELGATRMYVADADWQRLIRDFVERSELVVLQCGSSNGLMWELELVLRTLRPDQLLLCFPYRYPRARPRRIERREALYRAFREWAAPKTPQGLPAAIGESFFLYFSSAPPWKCSALLRSEAKSRSDHPRRALLSALADDALFRPVNAIGVLPFSFFSKLVIGGVVGALLMFVGLLLLRTQTAWGIAMLAAGVAYAVAVFRYL